QSGTVEIDVTRSGPAQSIYQSKGAPADRTSVRMIRLKEIPDPVAGEAVDLLKVDCEGAEFEIFNQADESDLRRFRFAVVEIHTTGRSETELNALVQRICDIGSFRAENIGRAVDARLVLFSPLAPR